MQKYKQNVIRENFFISSGVFLAVLFWILESYKHSFEFEELTFFSELFFPNTHELWMRSVIVALFLIYGFSSQILFNRIKVAEKNSTRAHAELDQIFQTAADGMRIVDKDFNTLRVNETFLSMAGLDIKEAEGKKCYEIFHGSKCHTAGCPLTKILKGEKRVEYETEKERKDGSKMSCIVTATPFLGTDNKLIGIVEDFKDISDRRRAEREKIKLQAELRHAQKMEAIGTLAGGIAHDFNNILAAILGYAGLVKKELPEKSQIYDDTVEIIKAGNRATELVRGILTFSRQEEQNHVPLQPSPIVKEVLKLIRASLPSTIEIREHIDPECKNILADPTKIHQILLNLCTNASHAMEDKGGVLDVSLNNVTLPSDNSLDEKDMEPKDFLMLEVSDTGQGIDQKIIDRIFDPYFTTKDVNKGSGLGLAMVHGIVQEHNGTITVESEAGKGSTFKVLFPVIQEETKICYDISGPLPTGNEKILLVDDEVIVLTVTKKILEGLGYQVTSMTSALESLEAFLAQPEKFDLVITDQTMPRMTGTELAQKLLLIRADIPIILCSGYSKSIDEEKAKAIGIRKYAMKPLATRKLAKDIRELLDK